MNAPETLHMLDDTLDTYDVDFFKDAKGYEGRLWHDGDDLFEAKAKTLPKLIEMLNIETKKRRREWREEADEIDTFCTVYDEYAYLYDEALDFLREA